MTLLHILLLDIPGGLVMTGQILLSLSILVFIHELGHFLAAKAFGMQVDKFYVFFDFGGKKLFSFKTGGTEYGLGWFPLGGYVKIAGMIDESMDKDQMKTEPQPWEFRSKPAWQRFIVMIGGVVMNIIAGYLIFAFWLHDYQEKWLPMSELKDGVYVHELGEELGFKTGDKILRLNDKEPERYSDLRSVPVFFGGRITIERDGKEQEIKLPGNLFKRISEPMFSPRHQSIAVNRVFDDSNADKAGLKAEDVILGVNGSSTNNFMMFREELSELKGESVNIDIERDGQPLRIDVEVTEEGTIGFESDVRLDESKYQLKDYTWPSSFKFATKEAVTTLVSQVIGFGKLFKGEIPLRESVQSPIGIATIFGPVWVWDNFWRLTAIISLVLAFMNILPIPALDGGHIVFIGIEMLRGKPVSDLVMERAQVAGMIFILALMVLVLGNDILKHVFGI